MYITPAYGKSTVGYTAPRETFITNEDAQREAKRRAGNSWSTMTFVERLDATSAAMLDLQGV